jgi:Chitobiase/beta-hexosaminidase C-terminal domain
MKRIATSLLLIFMFAFFGRAQELFQFAPPFMKYNSAFFKEQVSVSLLFAQAGAVIRYTTNGREPTEKDLVYRAPITITRNFTTLKAKVFGNNFLASETVQAVFVKDGMPLKSITYPAPAEQYGGDGANALMNNKGGIAAFTSNTWLGFQQDTVDFIISLNKKQKISTVLFNLLQNYDAWIFFPEKADIYYADKTGIFIKNGTLLLTPEANKDKNACSPFTLKFIDKVNTTSVKLQLHLLKQIPAWHPGKGQKSWIFIDEVKLY